MTSVSRQLPKLPSKPPFTRRNVPPKIFRSPPYVANFYIPFPRPSSSHGPGMSGGSNSPNVLQRPPTPPMREISVAPIDTYFYASDNSNPLTIPARRTLLLQNSLACKQLVWSIHCPVAVSRFSSVRNWIIRRVSAGVVKELEYLGLDRKGIVIDNKNGSKSERKSKNSTAITGWLRVDVDKTALTADFRSIRQRCKSTLNWVHLACHGPGRVVGKVRSTVSMSVVREVAGK